jgi:hypothetical protein
MNLYRVAEEIARRLTSIFLRDRSGRRPVNGGEQRLQEDPHWRDYIQFYEYFHGDNGAGLGASHQTGWTGRASEMPWRQPGDRQRCRDLGATITRKRQVDCEGLDARARASAVAPWARC